MLWVLTGIFNFVWVLIQESFKKSSWKLFGMRGIVDHVSNLDRPVFLFP